MSEKTAWQSFKEKQLAQQAESEQNVSIPQFEWADPKIYSERLLTCIECPAFIKESNICTECGCFMVLKTKLPNVTCPLSKW